MTSTTKEIFERYEVRKTRKQKLAFIQWLKPVVQHCGYCMNVEKGSFGSRNIIIGDPEKAKVIFSAHYDTCAVMPFPNLITPKNIWLYILYQLVITAAIFIIVFGITFLVSWIAADAAMWAYFLSLLGMLGLLFFGPANNHTANDNTSGVTAVIDLMNAMPAECKNDAAFIFFDQEEAGLIGSSSFASRHKKMMKDKLLVNLDCVSDGETILFCFRKKSKSLVEKFQEAFPSGGIVESDFVTKGYIYPSDQVNFPWGVGVAALKKSRGGVLYMDKIHTSKDTVYREENIEYLVEGSIRLIKAL